MTQILYLTLVLITLPAIAMAWGPATHLEYAHQALASLTLFAPLVKKLISRYEEHFLYGSVAADITLGKNVRGYLYNCHNWTVAMDIMENKTRDDKQKAFMLGYLGHLAVDTVAHNYFVPYTTIMSWQTKLMKHVYWEMRMDLTVDDKCWQLFEKFSQDHDDFANDDALLEEHLKRTFFSFKTNKKIFNSLLVFQKMEKYRTLANGVAEKSKYKLTDEQIKNFKGLAVNSLVDFLKRFDKSFVMQADPTGKLKIQYARNTVEALREACQTTQLDTRNEVKLLSDISLAMQKGIYEPHSMPDVQNYLG